MTDDLKKLAEAVIAAREAWSALPFRAPDHVSGPVNERCDEAIDAFNFAATPAAILALIRERDEAREKATCAKLEHAAAEAALSAAREEVERLRASIKIAVDWAEALKFFADSGTTLAPALAQLRDTLTKEPTHV